jgi:hypothetical protein
LGLGSKTPVSEVGLGQRESFKWVNQKCNNSLPSIEYLVTTMKPIEVVEKESINSIPRGWDGTGI